MGAPHPRPPRGAALALTLLFAVGQLAGFAHLVLVPHVTCPEHGELMHAEAAPAAPTLAGGPARAWLNRGARAHGHDHCLAFSSRREDVLAAAGPAAPEVQAPAPHSAPPARTPFAPPLALLRLAPKGSPPA